MRRPTEAQLAVLRAVRTGYRATGAGLLEADVPRLVHVRHPRATLRALERRGYVETTEPGRYVLTAKGAVAMDMYQSKDEEIADVGVWVEQALSSLPAFRTERLDAELHSAMVRVRLVLQEACDKYRDCVTRRAAATAVPA